MVAKGTGEFEGMLETLKPWEVSGESYKLMALHLQSRTSGSGLFSCLGNKEDKFTLPEIKGLLRVTRW